MHEGLEPARLAGAWTLREWHIGFSDGRADRHPFGTGATGLLLYTHDGHMSAGISAARRPGFGGGSVRSAGADAKAAAFDTYFHYQGTYAIEGDCIVHRVLDSLNPDFVGTTQVRHAKLEGDVLELSAQDTLPGTTVRRLHVLRWRRASGA